MLIDVFVTLLVIIAPPLRLSTFDGGALAQVSVLLNLKLLACKHHIRSIDHIHADGCRGCLRRPLLAVVIWPHSSARARVPPSRVSL